MHLLLILQCTYEFSNDVHMSNWILHCVQLQKIVNVLFYHFVHSQKTIQMKNLSSFFSILHQTWWYIDKRVKTKLVCSIQTNSFVICIHIMKFAQRYFVIIINLKGLNCTAKSSIGKKRRKKSANSIHNIFITIIQREWTERFVKSTSLQRIYNFFFWITDRRSNVTNLTLKRIKLTSYWQAFKLRLIRA